MHKQSVVHGHARGRDRRAHRWGKTKGKIGLHGGKVEIERPRLRGFDGKEPPVPSWEAAVAEDWLGKWAMNQMLINVAKLPMKIKRQCGRCDWFNSVLVEPGEAVPPFKCSSCGYQKARP